jgi:hypothetical protein
MASLPAFRPLSFLSHLAERVIPEAEPADATAGASEERRRG